MMFSSCLCNSGPIKNINKKVTKVMYKKFKSLIEKDFYKNILTVASGSVIAQMVGFSFSIITTRLYAPEDFGHVALFISVVSLLSIVAGAGYPIAIVLPKKDSEALAIAKLAIFIGLALSSVIAITLFFFGSYC